MVMSIANAFASLHRQNAAQRIVLKARSIGLNVYYERLTAGDGNCFYHAVLETIYKNFEPNFAGTHKDLRVSVSSFVRQHRYDDFVLTWEETHVSESADESIFDQFNLGVHATELFIHATAIMLNTVIIVTTADSTPEYPYSIFWPSLSSMDITPDLNEYTGRYILLGHENEHFQSLFFSGEVPWQNKNCRIDKPNNIKRTYADVISSNLPPMAKSSGRVISSNSGQRQSKIVRLNTILPRFDEKSYNPINLTNTNEYVNRVKVHAPSKQLKENQQEIHFEITSSSPIKSKTEPENEVQNNKANSNAKSEKRNNITSAFVESNVDSGKQRKKVLKTVGQSNILEMNKVEEKLKHECEINGVNYCQPSSTESKEERKARRRKLKTDIKKASVLAGDSSVKLENNLEKKNILTLNKAEEMLKQDCKVSGVDYQQPSSYENKTKRKARRRKLKNDIQAHDKKTNDVVGQDISGNPNVYHMINRFQEGENMHIIKTCTTCKETRPFFYETEPSDLFQHRTGRITSNWKIFPS